jgi:protein-disulfide isomerase
MRKAAAPPVRAPGTRRAASPKVLVGAGLLLAAVVAGIVLAVSLTGSSKKRAVEPLPGAADVVRTFNGIRQSGQVLGAPAAPVTLIEYIDLQCPSCRLFETQVMPSIVERYVRPGRVKVEARPVAIIGDDSRLGQRAALAAGLQNHLFDFSQLLYSVQGAENSGWLDETAVRSAAASIPGLDGQALVGGRGSARVKAAVAQIETQARDDGVSGTPTVLVARKGARPVEVTPGYIPSVDALAAALDRALR